MVVIQSLSCQSTPQTIAEHAGLVFLIIINTTCVWTLFLADIQMRQISNAERNKRTLVVDTHTRNLSGNQTMEKFLSL